MGKTYSPSGSHFRRQALLGTPPYRLRVVQYTHTVTVCESCLRSVQFVWCLKLLTVRKEKYTVRKEEYTIRKLHSISDT